MSRAYSHKIEALPDEGGPLRESGNARPRPSLVVERTLDDLLERCADGDGSDVDALLRWQNGRIGITLERMLGDPELVQQALQNLLADLADFPAVRRAGVETAEDWLFGRLRWHARSLEPQAHPAASRQALPPAAQPAQEVLAGSVPVAEPMPFVDLEPPAVYPRLRRPNARAHSTTAYKIALAEAPRPSRWRRVAVFLLLWLAAGTAGFAALTLLVPGRPAAPPPVAVVVPPVLEPPPQPAAPAPDARTLLGPPIAAREPAPMALPQQLATEDEPLAAPAAPRVVIHYSAGNASGATLARDIAAALGGDSFGEPEIRAVPQTVVTASVRYFHGADRDAAARLVASVRALLAGAGRAAPVTPIDFTDFTPSPRPGTLEIWIPSR